MGKTQHVGTSADDLRQATQDANAAMKDLQQVKREILQLLDKVAAHKEIAVREVDKNLNAAIANYQISVQKTLDEVAERAVLQLTTRLDATAKDVVDGVAKAVSGLPSEKRGEAAISTLSAILANSDRVGPPGVALTVNGKHIASCVPVDTKGMTLSSGCEWPEIGPDCVRRKCDVCKRQVWVRPDQIHGQREFGVELLCVVCCSMLVKKAPEFSDMTIVMANGDLITGRG